MGGPAAAILLILALIGDLAWSGFLGGIAGLALVSAIGAWIWRADLDRLTAMLDQAGAAGTRAGAWAGLGPRLPSLLPLASAARQFARRLDESAALFSGRRMSDAVIVEHLPDPLIVLDAEGHLVRANRAARGSFNDALPAVLRHPELRSALARAHAGDTLETAEIALAVPIERTVLATVLGSRGFGEAEVASGETVIVLSDRTRERAVERLRADFIANASHELRTPLAGLIGFIETLRGPAADDAPAQRRFLGIMAGEAARMQRLIDDLMSLSRIELIEHQPPVGIVCVSELLPDLVAGFERRLAERGMAATIEVADGLPALPADPDQISRVVRNLIDNAVKYGRAGGRIAVTAEPEAGGVAIVVADDGPGIARRHLGRLTERFYRVDEGRSQAAGGTGLGLAIVKHIMNRHRGRLSIESTEGVGTICRAWLPAAEGMELRPGEAGQPPAPLILRPSLA